MTPKLTIGQLLSLFLSAAASACPVCHSDTGRLVRAGIFNEDFLSNLLITAAPFPIFLGIVGLIHFGFSNRKSRKQNQE